VTPATAERKLSDLSAEEVRQLASDHEVEGRSNMTKAERVKALEKMGVKAPESSNAGSASQPSASAEAKEELSVPELLEQLRKRGVDVPEVPPAASVPPEPAEPAKVGELSHSRPILAPGSAGEDVRELCRLLELQGYETSMSRGENAFSVLDASVLGAVQQFRRSAGVEEAADESVLTTDEHRAAIVGPQTWEALYQAAA
jgi:peptidoglycan hydrolase-like protein with peptidoglycan-binding domain